MGRSKKHSELSASKSTNRSRHSPSLKARAATHLDKIPKASCKDSFNLVEPQINAEGIHVWPFDASFPVDVLFLKIVRRFFDCYIGRMSIKYCALLAMLLFGSFVASAQSPSIAGTWILARAEKLLPDGTRVSDYGDSPHGIVIFTSDGYYSVQIYGTARLKFSSGDKFKGTPEEYKEASLTTSVHFGRYSIDPVKATITFHIDRSSFPNQDDTTQVRPYEITGDELSWRVAQRLDGSIPITVLHRVRGN